MELVKYNSEDIFNQLCQEDSVERRGQTFEDIKDLIDRIITENNDTACERCGLLRCEEDNHHEKHSLFKSNKEDIYICRSCVNKEDKLEDEKE